jgi:hypothetical protein
MTTRKNARNNQNAGTLDLVAAQKKLERQAVAVLAFINSDAPDFITDAVNDAIAEAARRTGFRSPTYDDDHESKRETIKILAALFSQTRLLTLRPQNTRAELAEHIAGVLNHPLCPGDLFDAIGDEVATLSRELDHDAPDHIRRVLEAAAAKESEATR